MAIELLPPNFDALVNDSVRRFWNTRDTSAGEGQDGNRGSVLGGKTMNGFLGVVRAVTEHCGLPASSLHTDGKAVLTLPGFFRPTKNWDAVVIHKHRLIAAFEFKSQVGPSFGNNLNNRTEEALGNAVDLWEAHRAGAYEPANHKTSGVASVGAPVEDPRRPFLGWLMLVEECPKSMRAVTQNSQHFRVFPEFQGASYAARYRILCERLMSKNLYSSAALIMSTREAGTLNGENRALTEPTSVRAMFAEYAGRAAAAAMLAL